MLRNASEEDKEEFALSVQEISSIYQENSLVENEMRFKVKEIKTKVKYLLQNNEFTKSLLNLYFSTRKEGISSWKRLLSEEVENYHCRMSWYVDKQEWKKQRNTLQNKTQRFIIGVHCAEKEQDIFQTLDSIREQSYTQWEIYLMGISEEVFKNSFQSYDTRIRYTTKDTLYSSDVVNEQGYYGEVEAGDILHPTFFAEALKMIENEMPDLLYTDENMFEKNCKSAYAPVYKPDFSMDTLRSFHYIGDFFLISLHAWKKLEKLNSDFSGRKGYQYLLLAGENEMSVAHIPKIMYYKKVIKGISSQDKIPWEEKMLREHLERTGYARGTSLKTSSDGIHRICYGLRETPLISIVIPNKDHVNDLKRCLESILNKTTYKQYEILVVENNSTEESVFRYYEDLEQDARIRVIYWSQEFNYSAINNFAVKQAKGEQIVLLNNDVEIISENWLEEMLMYAQREDVGAVGAMLYYPGDTIQHAGVILGIGGVAGHSHKHCKRGQKGYQYRLCTVQNLSAVTAACMMTSKKKFLEVGGLEQQLQIAFNDIDYCMKLRKKGYSIIFTPYAELYHYESISRGYETTSEKEERFRGEIKYFQEKWGSELEKGDPFYNPHLTLRYEDFRLK